MIEPASGIGPEPRQLWQEFWEASLTATRFIQFEAAVLAPRSASPD